MRNSRGQFIKGHKNIGIPPIGKHWKLSEQTKKRISLANKGKHISPQTEFQKGHQISFQAFGKINPMWKGGKPRCQKCNKLLSHYTSRFCRQCENPERIKKIGEYQRKKVKEGTHHLWKGGITPLKHQIRVLSEYNQWRKTIFERDNWTCQICGVRGGKLHIDHYPKSFAQILQENNIQSLDDAMNCQELWDVNNGRTLCIECHKQTSTYLKPLNIAIGSCAGKLSGN